MAVAVILDTDIGMDVDDVWALALLLRCPEIDLKLVVSATGDTTYRAALAARLLEIAGRDDVPVGIGIPLDDSPRTHAAWLGDYSLDRYPGSVYGDGVGAICETIAQSTEPVTVIGIGPLPNLAAALARDPQLTTRSRFVGMHGSLRRGYLDAPKPMREYNVKLYSQAARAVFESAWDRTITPLDTCGNVYLSDARFQRLLATADPLGKAVLDNHFGWFEAARDWPLLKDLDPHRRSSVLFDTVAVYLAFAEDWLEMETLPIIVSDDGRTLIDDAGRPTRCATGWRDREAFLDFVTERLT